MSFYEYFIGWRYLKSRRSDTFLSIISLISIGGVAVGVMALIVVLSVMNGFSSDIKDRILGSQPHLVVEAKKSRWLKDYDRLSVKLAKISDEIIAVEPFIKTEIIINTKRFISGAILKGVRRLPGGPGLPQVMLGEEIALTIGAFKGDVCQIISPYETTGPLGAVPKTEEFLVSGTLRTGVYEYDNKFCFTSLEEAQRFLGLEKVVSGLEIKLKNIFRTEKIEKKMMTLLGSDFQVRNWKELNQTLFSALKLEKLAMFIILVLIVIVASFNIISTLLMVVLGKQKEISILRALGAQAKSIIKIFIFNGLIIGGAGTILGMLGGYGICYWLDKYQPIRLPDIYYNTTLPVKMEWGYFILLPLVTLFITFLAALYPAWLAAKFKPLDGIKYEK